MKSTECFCNKTDIFDKLSTRISYEYHINFLCLIKAKSFPLHDDPNTHKLQGTFMYQYNLYQYEKCLKVQLSSFV